MRLSNASQLFQQMMEDRLFPVRDTADPYIDDILIGTRALPGEDLLAKHEQDLRRVVEVLKAEKLVCVTPKSVIFSWRKSNFVAKFWAMEPDAQRRAS